MSVVCLCRVPTANRLTDRNFSGSSFDSQSIERVAILPTGDAPSPQFDVCPHQLNLGRRCEGRRGIRGPSVVLPCRAATVAPLAIRSRSTTVAGFLARSELSSSLTNGCVLRAISAMSRRLPRS